MPLTKSIMVIGIIAAIAAIIGGSAAVYYSQGGGGSQISQQLEQEQPVDQLLSQVTERPEKQLDVKLSFAANPISRGSTQTIEILVLDSETQEPVKEADVRVTVAYASGGTTKFFSGETDIDGSLSFSWQIGGASQTGTFATSLRASAAEYSVTSVESGFEVVPAS